MSAVLIGLVPLVITVVLGCAGAAKANALVAWKWFVHTAWRKGVVAATIARVVIVI